MKKSNLSFVSALPMPVQKIPTAVIHCGIAFKGTITGVYGSPYKGVFYKVGGALIQIDAEAGTWFNPNKGTIEDFEQVDLEIKAVPHVS